MGCGMHSIRGCVMPLTNSHEASTRRARVRRLIRAAVRWILVGAGVGTSVSLGLLAVWTPRTATDTAFALGGVLLGFGVIAWSTATGLGRTIEGMQDMLEVSSDWTEASARQAFFVLSWTGTGWILAAIVCAVVLGV